MAFSQFTKGISRGLMYAGTFLFTTCNRNVACPLSFVDPKLTCIIFFKYLARVCVRAKSLSHPVKEHVGVALFFVNKSRSLDESLNPVLCFGHRCRSNDWIYMRNKYSLTWQLPLMSVHFFSFFAKRTNSLKAPLGRSCAAVPAILACCICKGPVCWPSRGLWRCCIWKKKAVCAGNDNAVVFEKSRVCWQWKHCCIYKRPCVLPMIALLYLQKAVCAGRQRGLWRCCICKKPCVIGRQHIFIVVD